MKLAAYLTVLRMQRTADHAEELNRRLSDLRIVDLIDADRV